MALKKKKLKKGGGFDNLKAAAILTTALVLMGGVIVLNYQSKELKEHTDANSCRTDVYPEITAILIDHTDTFTPIQKDAVSKRLETVATGVRKNGMIEFYSVSSIKNAVLSPDFHLCNPGDENDLNNKLGKRRETVRQEYETKFKDALTAGLNKVFDESTAQQSPIMDALQSVNVTAFLGEKRKADYKRLILISDLLEHTDKLSFFRGVPDFNEYRKTAYWSSVKSDLRGIYVEIFLLRRESEASLQNRDLQTFWEAFFLEQGAVEVKFIII